MNRLLQASPLVSDQRRVETRAIASLSLSAPARAVLEQYSGARSSSRTIQGYEAMNMIRKGQVRRVSGDDVLHQIRFIKKLFDLAT
jgi:hypothetical protein